VIAKIRDLIGMLIFYYSHIIFIYRLILKILKKEYDVYVYTVNMCITKSGFILSGEYEQ